MWCQVKRRVFPWLAPRASKQSRGLPGKTVTSPIAASSCIPASNQYYTCVYTQDSRCSCATSTRFLIPIRSRSFSVDGLWVVAAGRRPRLGRWTRQASRPRTAAGCRSPAAHGRETCDVRPLPARRRGSRDRGPLPRAWLVPPRVAMPAPTRARGRNRGRPGSDRRDDATEVLVHTGPQRDRRLPRGSAPHTMVDGGRKQATHFSRWRPRISHHLRAGMPRRARSGSDRGRALSRGCGRGVR